MKLRVPVHKRGEALLPGALRIREFSNLRMSKVGLCGSDQLSKTGRYSSNGLCLCSGDCKPCKHIE